MCILQKLGDTSCDRRCSVKKSVYKNFTKFTGKPMCWSLLFNKVAGEAPDDCFSWRVSFSVVLDKVMEIRVAFWL